jgi:hypothetical protein
MSLSYDREQTHHTFPAFPVEYGEGRVCSLLYLVDATQARRRLVDTGVFPVTVGNHALLSITWFDYARSALGPYQELSVGLVVDSQKSLLRITTSALLRRFLTLGTFVVALPVTSALACAAGIEKLALPKTLMELPLTWSRGVLDATALVDSKRVLSMRIPMGIGLRTSVPSLVIYSRREGTLLRTTVKTDFRPQIDLVGRPRLTIEDARHPLSQELSHWHVETAPCLGIAHGPLAAAKLFAPEAVNLNVR